MTQRNDSYVVPDDPYTPRYEPWLGITASALVPVMLMFVLPPNFLWPMITLAMLLLVMGFVSWIRQERRARTIEQPTRSEQG